jgi:integrase
MSKTKLNFTKAILEELPTPFKGKRAYYYDTKMRGLGVSITSAGTKTFIVYRWVSGKPERVTIGRYPDLSIEQARGKAGEINGMIANGQNPNDIRRAELAEITFGELFSEYLESYAKTHKRSWKEDQNQFKRYLAPWIKRKLSIIRKQDIQRLHHDVGKENGTYGANRLLALLSIVFNKAIEFGLWDKTNPAHGIKKFKEHSRDRFLQSDELPHFFQALSEEPNTIFRDYFLMLLLTGARRSNVLQMKWEEISFNRNEWRIPRTKNDTAQVVTLTDEAVAILKARQSKASSQYVFPGIGKAGHLSDPKKAWTRVLQRAGLNNLRIHDLRRTMGSWQAKTGASLAIIGKSLNHKCTVTTAIYARLDLDPVRESLEKATAAMFLAAGVKSETNKLDLDGLTKK